MINQLIWKYTLFCSFFISFRFISIEKQGIINLGAEDV